MARLGTKAPMLHVVTDDVARVLDRCSKAALIDAFVQTLATSLGSCDTAPSMADVRGEMEPVLQARGDRSPFAPEEV